MPEGCRGGRGDLQASVPLESVMIRYIDLRRGGGGERGV